jgi:dienelactone hydrolase
MAVFPEDKMRKLLQLCVILSLCLKGIASAGGHEKFVNYEVNSKAFQAYMAQPASAPKGKVFIVHDWDGLTDYEKKRADMLVELGHQAIALDLFGVEARLEGFEDYRREASALYGNRAEFRARLNAAISAASATFDADLKEILIGFCFGGAAVLEAARAGFDLDGFVSIHGGLGTPEGQDYSATTGPVLLLHGSADPVSGMDNLAAVLNQLQEANILHGAEIFGGARHSFTIEGSRDYNQAAEQGSWNAFMHFLEGNTGS